MKELNQVEQLREHLDFVISVTKDPLTTEMTCCVALKEPEGEQVWVSVSPTQALHTTGSIALSYEFELPGTHFGHLKNCVFRNGERTYKVRTPENTTMFFKDEDFEEHPPTIQYRFTAEFGLVPTEKGTNIRTYYSISKK
jgi:hypothetical protein